MIPIQTTVKSEKTESGLPWMTLTLTMLCLLGAAFVTFLDPRQQSIIIDVLGANPAEVSLWLQGEQRPAGHFGLDGDRGGGWAALVLSLFLHTSWLHLLGNLAYLWVFGLPVERRTGHLSLLAVFLLGGVLSHLMLALRLPDTDLAVIGASGAVSAVVGACAGLYPGRRIGLYLPLGLVLEFVRVPTMLVVGSWFALQLLYSLFGPISGAMAWWTHVAGFVVGLLFAVLVRAVVALRYAISHRAPS